MRCPDDNALNAYLEGIAGEAARSEVEKHLDVCARCRELAWASGALGASLSSRTVGYSAEADPEIMPATIGRYQLRGLLGEGAMGRTYLGHDPELDRPVCLKVLKSSAGGDPAAERQRLLQEARAQARLSDPAIVSVYEIVSAGTVLALVMEYLPGAVTLRAWLAAAARSPEEIVAVLVQAGEGLAAAHASGIAHRDFKPDNVLLTAAGRARIVDFGLARRVLELEDSTAELPAETHTKTVAAGTPAYMAPEQFAGEPGDARSDQYSFCVALYEALTGRRPFLRDSLSAQLRAQRAGNIPPFSASPEVRAVLLRGLSPQPQDRFESMRALLGALSSRTVEPPRGGKRWAVAATVGVVLAAIAGTVYSMRVEPPRSPELLSSRTSAPVVTASVAQVLTAPAVEKIEPPRTVEPRPKIARTRPRPQRVRGTGELELRVSPWAYVSLDGKLLGPTPLPVQTVADGAHELLFERPDLGVRETKKIVIIKGERSIVRHVVNKK